MNIDNLSFEKGLVGDSTVDILQHVVKKDKVQENLNNRHKEGRTAEKKLIEHRNYLAATC